MKKLFLLLVLAFGACAMPIEPATDSDPQGEEAEVDGIKQDVWCFGFPYETMAFPVNQGAWEGSGAGQVMRAPFWTDGCKPAGTEFGYGQIDGEINLNRSVPWLPSTCWTWKSAYNSGVVCNNQPYECPVQACLTEPVTWKNSPTEGTSWGWSQWSAISSTVSAAPGNHGIWPKVPTQCSTGVGTPQFNPNGAGGTLLACKYTMPTFWLRQN